MYARPMRAISVTVSATSRTAPERAFDVIAPIDLPRIFLRFGPIPAVVRTRDQTGPWSAVGESRVVELADGSSAPERLTAYERPAHFGYRVGPFDGALGRLVDHADGAWWFREAAGGTEIRWTYRFHPRRGIGLLVWAIVPFWRGYAGRALARGVRIAEAPDPA